MPTLQSAFDTRTVLPVIGLEGEITFAAIAKLTQITQRHTPSVIVGVGGGETLDIAKGVAHTLACPIITVLTIASTDAPTSKAIAIYDEHHRMVAVEQMQRKPELALVDSWFGCKAKSMRRGLSSEGQEFQPGRMAQTQHSEKRRRSS